MTEANQPQTWRVDPYGKGLWRVVAVAPGTPIIVNCGWDRAKAEALVADHAAATKLADAEGEIRVFMDRNAELVKERDSAIAARDANYAQRNKLHAKLADAYAQADALGEALEANERRLQGLAGVVDAESLSGEELFTKLGDLLHNALVANHAALTAWREAKAKR